MENAKVKTDAVVPNIMETDMGIPYLQDFLANARRGYPLENDLSVLEDFKRILETNADDQLFQEVFPKEVLGDALDKAGMGYKELRTRLIPNCARKVYDMLSRQLRSPDTEKFSPRRLAICRDLCEAAKAAMTPSF